MTTQILEQHPGYYWREGVLEWAPVVGFYSPPLLHKPMRVRTVPVTQEVEGMIGNVIGKDGKYLKWITERSKTHYIFFKDGVFEIWGSSDRVIRFATQLLHQHLEHQRLKHFFFPPLSSITDVVAV